MRWKKGIKLWLSFSQGERNGIIVLLGILLVQLFVLNHLHWFLPEPETDFSAFHAAVAQMKAAEKAEVAKEKPTPTKPAMAKPEASIPVAYFKFNPNHLNEEGWQKLGLKNWQSKMILKYRAKGGKFRIKSDLQKMYSIDEALYQQLEPWIELPDSLPKTNYANRFNTPVDTNKKIPAHPKVLVAVNTADTAQWKSLRGIGPVLSKRIIKYRDRLGGFRSEAQLREVWGLRPEVVDRIAPQLAWDTTFIQQLNINTLPADSLWKHPYISYNLARVIVAYREQHGPYKRVMDVRQTDLVDHELYRKIAPYLKVN
ncbi:MAG: ComEA family DNA-binding protein [Salibacteraceae bacterium]